MQTQEPTEATVEIIPIVPSVRQVWRAVLDPWWKATLAVLPTFLLTRLIFILLTYFGGILFFAPNYWTGQLSFLNVVYTWYRWDAIRFVKIANGGYLAPEFAAFFPLYPTLERVLSKLLHLDVLVTGMLISNLAFLGTLIVLYRLTETEFDREIARRTVLYLAIFPTAMFFFAAYNESLFLLFMLLCYYSLRRSSWWLAGLFGFLATLTRSIGLFMIVIFVYEFWRQNHTQLRQDWAEKTYLHLSRSLISLLPILIIPLALIIYAVGLDRRFGDPLAFVHAQAHWRLGLSFPWRGPHMALKELFSESLYTFTSAHILIDLTALVLFIALLALCFVGPERLERRHWSFVLFGLMALLYSLIFPGIPAGPGVPYDPIPSTQRFVLEIFIGFILLARLGKRPWFHQGYLMLSLPLLAFFTLQFMTGHWTI